MFTSLMTAQVGTQQRTTQTGIQFKSNTWSLPAAAAAVLLMWASIKVAALAALAGI
jgi:hypothetical protein